MHGARLVRLRSVAADPDRAHHPAGLDDRHREATGRSAITERLLSLATTEEGKMGMELLANLVAQGRLTAEQAESIGKSWVESGENYGELAAKIGGA